jgi:hypothetical protein
VIFTWALLTTAPLGSVTRPVTEAIETDCAWIFTAVASTRIASNALVAVTSFLAKLCMVQAS